jgi:hypothetical protein
MSNYINSTLLFKDNKKAYAGMPSEQKMAFYKYANVLLVKIS